VRHAYETTLPTIDETYLQFPRFIKTRAAFSIHTAIVSLITARSEIWLNGTSGAERTNQAAVSNLLDIKYSESFGRFTNRRRHVTSGTDYCKSDAIVIRTAFRFIHRWRQDIRDF